MSGKTKNKTDKIDPNKLKTRDYNMLALIKGATKSGVFKDRKKDADKKACRGRCAEGSVTQRMQALLAEIES